MKKNEELVELLINNNSDISFAESCTGGLLASGIVDVSNASKVLKESYVTYSNEAKHRILGVKYETIETYNITSPNVALEMAMGVQRLSNAKIVVTTTGVAGPSGGTETHPVGMVCFGFIINGKVMLKTKVFKDTGRNNIRKKAVNYAYSVVIKELKKY